MTPAAKKNGPASAGTDPDLGSTNPKEEISMNAHSFNTTTITPATSSVAALIEAHKAALADSAQKWDAVTNAEESIIEVPLPGVPYSRELLMHQDENGQSIYRPIYAFSEAQIDAEMDKRLKCSIAAFWKGAEVFRQNIEERRAILKAELRRQISVRKNAEAKAGLPKARKAAQAASKRVDACLADIFHHSVMSADVRLVAAYLVKCNAEGEEGVDDETLMDFVKALAGMATT